jgi:hypothetical protein
MDQCGQPSAAAMACVDGNSADGDEIEAFTEPDFTEIPYLNSGVLNVFGDQKRSFSRFSEPVLRDNLSLPGVTKRR